MNMEQPDPSGLFDQFQKQRQRPPPNKSVTAQISQRPVLPASVPAVQVPGTAEAQALQKPPEPPVNPLVALYESGIMEKSVQQAQQKQALPENPFKQLYDSGVMTQSVLEAEDREYDKQLEAWQNQKIEPLTGMQSSNFFPSPTAGTLPKPEAPARELDQIVKDWQNNVHYLRGQELGGVLAKLEAGELSPEQEASITQYIEPALTPELKKELQVSRMTKDKYLAMKGEYDRQMAEQKEYADQLGPDARRQLTSPEEMEFFRSLGRELSFGYAYSPDEDRLNSDNPEEVADERARRIFYNVERAENPISSLTGGLLGAAVPIGLTALPIRAARAAMAGRALKAGPPTAQTANVIARGGAPATVSGNVAEGMLASLPYDVLYRIPGSEDMTDEELREARLQQIVYGAALGAAGDVGLSALARGASRATQGIKEVPEKILTAKTNRELDKLAKKNGFDNVDQMIEESFLTTVKDETGERIRLQKDILDILPDPDRRGVKDVTEITEPGAAVTDTGGTGRTEFDGGQRDVTDTAVTTRSEELQAVERPATGEVEAAVSGREESVIAEPPTERQVTGKSIVEAPVDELKLSNDVPQFKEGADQQGVVEPLGGAFDRTGVGPIQVWVRNDGSKEVISGRHRLDLAKRSGEKTIPAQYHYESEGFGRDQAASLDAMLNIREGQGKVKDYVDFIQNSGLTKQEADTQGILARATGRRAYTIATEGSDSLIAAHRGNQLSDEAASRIAQAAPNNERLQAVGIKAIQDGKSITVAENMVKAVRTMTDDTAVKSGDMFGFDDSALIEAETLARKAAAKQADIQKTLSAVQGAAKNPELAAKEGVDVKDPEAVKRRIAELRQQKQDWQNWHTNPALTAELRGETVPPAQVEPEAPARQQEGFDLTSQTESELTARDNAARQAEATRQQEQAELEARDRADQEAKDFELGIQGSGKDVSGKQADLLGAGNNKPPPGTTLYSSPVIPAAKQVASLLHLNPSGSLGGAVYGGIAAGDASDAERFSPQWWIDSSFGALTGAVAGAAGSHAIKKIPVKGKPLFGKQSWANDSFQFMKKQLQRLPIFNRGDEEVLALGKQQRLMDALIKRQAEKAGEYLLKNFTPAERSVMADLIEQRGILAEGNLLHQQAKELDDFIGYTSKKLQDLGMLEGTIEPGGYLHRYYSKHLGLTGAAKALTPKGRSISGTWSIRRGTQEVFDSRYMSQSMRGTLDQVQTLQNEFNTLKRQTGDLVDSDTQARLDDLKAQVHELQSIEFREYLAPENGTLKSFFLAADEVPVIPGLKKRPATGLPELDKQGSLEGMAKPEQPGSKNDLVLTDRRWTIDGMKEDGSGILHRDWTKAERKSWGEITDAAYRMVRGQAEVAHDLSLGTFFKQVNDRFEGQKVSDTLVEGWQKVPDTTVGKGSRLKKYGALSGKYVTPDVWKAIKNHGRNPILSATNNHPAVAVYLKALGKWKAYKTVYNIVSHFNNSVSNLQMYYLSDYEAKYLARAFTELRKGEASDLYREANNSGLFGTDYTSELAGGSSQNSLDELLEKLRTQPDIPDFEESLDTVMRLKQWFIESSESVKNVTGPWKTGAELAKAVGNPLLNTAKKPIRKAANAMQSAYRMEDEFFKMAVYLAERNKGTKPSEAVKAANQYFFDYNDMPDAVKVVRDLPIGSPFLSYTYFAIPAIVRTAVEKPERILALAASLEGVNYAGMVLNDELQNQGYWDRMADENELYPDWMKGRTIWGGANNLSIPFIESYKLSLANANVVGNPMAGNVERGGAWPAVLSFWGAGWYGSNPITTLINDVTNNQDWRGNEIWSPGAPASERIRAAVNYVYQNITPSNPLFPGSYHQQKILEGLANQKRSALEEGEEPNFIVGGIVDLANAVSESLGGTQFTGLDRRGNEILTRDALGGSVGFKLRPVRIDQFEEGKYWDFKEDINDITKWIKKKERLYSEGRLTERQIEKSRLDAESRLNVLNEKEKRLREAVKNQTR